MATKNSKASSETKLLAAIEARRAILEHAVNGVVKGFATALFVWGPPGLGKSHLLTLMLDGVCGSGWRHHTAHSTPKALFQSLANDPGSIHLYEDCEKLLKTDLSASILRAACGAPNDRDRWITYETANEVLKVRFTGGIIIATNANLNRTNGPMAGVASRFRPIRWDLSYEERIATLMSIARRSWVKCGVPITQTEAIHVASTLIKMCSTAEGGNDLDLRLFTEHALPAFAQAKGNPSLIWEDLVLTKLRGIASTVNETQDARTQHMQQLAVKISMEGGSFKSKIAKWRELTGMSQAIYYRHLKAAKRPQ
jgi:hypothetical protein